ncbi:MAG: glycyl-radical enzyme activating protein [Actinomycetota bacterium]
MAHEATGSVGVIFDIQRYCVYDGPGIRTGVFLKGCPMRCFWCHNPESQQCRPQVRFLATRCDGCGACVERCDVGAIRLRKGKLLWDFEHCNDCGECADVCTENAFARIGEELSVAQTMERVMADRDFFAGSHGGVTVSGGEPTMQPEFLLHLLRALRQDGIHTALDTCGHFPGRLLPQLLETVDLFLFDIKHADDQEHQRATGFGNRRILENFRDLLAKVGSARVTVRVPLVPGFNTEPGDIEAVIEVLTSAGYEGEVHLMPYHGWAKSKYESLGRFGDYRDLSDTPPADTDRVIAQFAAHGLETRLYG